MKIKIAENFSDTPGGRFLTDGDFSGEEFKLKVLSPAYSTCVQDNTVLIIDFDGCYGFSQGFLEESFGGLVRMGYPYDDVLNRLVLESSEDPDVLFTVKKFILEAGKRQVEILKEEGKIK